ncbi:MAG: aminotransferase class I/II-fold pyridoxal phosphate-dependent enzyme [Dehalococcoidales bacterium]|nr:aminotransferase class I/II-fold pyridoxal phosphate-dependent enzyme [Dehalococcoidales bacterium]
MAMLNPQAEELNRIIKTQSATVYELLSKKGKAIYFPRKGILAQGMAAKDKEINATIGTAYEDDGSPMILPSVARHIEIDSKEAFPYAPSEGSKPLREKWKALMMKKNPSLGTKEFSLPVITCGVTHGLSMVGYMFAEETDDIIIADLYWENYDLVFTSGYGAGLKFFNFFKGKLFDIDSFRETVNAEPKGKKIVLLNFPNNPSGYAPTKEAAYQIINVLKEAAEAGNKLAVILDDSYFGLDFEEGIFTESLFSQLAHAHENLLAIKMDGITKEEYAWGFRVGFVTYGIKNGGVELYKALEDKTAGAVRGNISNAPHLSQSLLLHALQSETHEKEKERNKAKLKERYLKVKETIKAHKEYEQYFEALPFNSGYFMCVRLKNLDTDKVWDLLLKKYSTGVICYSEKNLLRIAFASTPLDKIEKLFDNIYAACKDCASA